MIYRSNLTAPDLQPAFKHVHCRPMGHSMGHDVLSDFADRPEGDQLLGLYKNCGFWTHDEAAILFNVARVLPGPWIDIGCHTMWTSAHLAAADCDVLAIDPMLEVKEFRDRALENKHALADGANISAMAATSKVAIRLLMTQGPEAFGVVVDGDHEHPNVTEDAELARQILAETGFVLFHDFIGRPVRNAVEYLMQRHGFKCRIYWTPHMIACCWRGDLQPPDHVRDPGINWEGVKSLMSDFDFGACQ